MALQESRRLKYTLARNYNTSALVDDRGNFTLPRLELSRTIPSTVNLPNPTHRVGLLIEFLTLYPADLWHVAWYFRLQTCRKRWLLWFGVTFADLFQNIQS